MCVILSSVAVCVHEGQHMRVQIACWLSIGMLDAHRSKPEAKEKGQKVESIERIGGKQLSLPRLACQTGQTGWETIISCERRQFYFYSLHQHHHYRRHTRCHDIINYRPNAAAPPPPAFFLKALRGSQLQASLSVCVSPIVRLVCRWKREQRAWRMSKQSHTRPATQ